MSSSTTPDDMAELVGQVIPKSFNAGYIVLSYIISYVGAWTTLELINRRTAMRGLYNWFLLIGSSISMGGIAIWCMHFIGNRAIVLGDGHTDIQIAYSAGFTALSFFLPIVVLFLAFWAVGSNEKVSVVRVSLGGTLAGLSICGMHYLGQAGISNYDCLYNIGMVVGSAVIAVVASVTALFIFFVWRSTWETSWWRRGINAVVLAGAVSGMHWLASSGTKYRLRAGSSGLSSNFSRNSTVIVVIVLSIGACLILLALTLLAQIRRARSANRAQQVVLAAAVFDADGRIMVSPEGFLPTRKITNTFVERSFDDIFSISHPVFLWIFRTTRNWGGVKNLLSGMRFHTQNVAVKSTQPGRKAEVNLSTDQGAPIEDYSIIFRELFCVAAADLADDMNRPLEDIGVLFDQIIRTGQKPKLTGNNRNTPDSSVDLEREGLSLPMLGRGQLLFVISKVERREAEHLQAAGFRFAVPGHVGPILARSLQVDRDELLRQVDNMREYASGTQILDPGVHIAFFCVRAAVQRGFDVLARRDARNQLPTMQLPFQILENWQLEYLRVMNSYSVNACIKYLSKAATSSTASLKEQLFATPLLTTLQALKDEINDPIFEDALLIAQPIQAPCRGLNETSPPGFATLLVFRLIAPIHTRAPGQKLEWIPLEFFRMQQHVYPNSPDHAVFARTIYREFAPVLDVHGRPSITDSKSSKYLNVPTMRTTRVSSISAPRTPDSQASNLKGNVDAFGKPITTLLRKESRLVKRSGKPRLWNKNTTRQEEQFKGDNSSEKNLVDMNGSEPQGFGGILVSQEISVDVTESHYPASSPGDESPTGGDKGAGIEMMELKSPTIKNGIVAQATREESEKETFVDQLFSICAADKSDRR